MIYNNDIGVNTSLKYFELTYRSYRRKVRDC